MKEITYIMPRKSVVLLALGSSLMLSCFKGQEEPIIENNSDSLQISVNEPISRDFAEIKNSGVIRMITNYSSNSYFIQNGIVMGFEYELIKSFAKENDLSLEVIITTSNQSPYDLLNSGEGDLIAANYTITQERRELVSFTRPYNMVNQVLVYNSDVFDELGNELDLSSIPITINRNSSYHQTLKSEEEVRGQKLNIQYTDEDVDTESLLLQVANGTYEATIADDNILKTAQNYIDNLVEGPTVAQYDTVAWAVRKNSPDLNTALSRYLYRHFRFGSEKGEVKRSAFLNILRNRYFEDGSEVSGFYQNEIMAENMGRISPYDPLIQEKAVKYDLDWLMVTSMIAQESKFNPNSESWAGAIGLMQVLPRYSSISKDSLFIPEVNVEEGAKIIREHLNHYSYLDSTNQWAFALATYNAGVGHLADARRLVIDQNKDPNQWEHVSEALLKLMQRKHYDRARYGFARGIETVRYVNEILNRYKAYNSILSMAQQRSVPLRGVMGIKSIN